MRRHELDLTSMVWGVLFLGVAGLAALDETVGLTWSPDPRWVLPVLLLVLGALGLVSALRRTGRTTSGGEPPA